MFSEVGRVWDGAGVVFSDGGGWAKKSRPRATGCGRLDVVTGIDGLGMSAAGEHGVVFVEIVV